MKYQEDLQNEVLAGKIAVAIATAFFFSALAYNVTAMLLI